MGWDDSDEEDEWDAEDIEAKLEAQLKEKERAKRRAEGLSDSDEEKPPEPPKEPPEPPKEPVDQEAKPKAKPKPKKKGKEKVEEVKEEEAPPLDSQAEKLRRQKLVEEADARLAEDLFSGCAKPDEAATKKAKEEEERKKQEEARKAAAAAAKPKVVVVDAFDQVELKLRADVEKLCMTCVEKVNKGQAKGAALKFLKDVLVQLESQLELKELDELEKEFAAVLKEKQVQRGAQQSKANKVNTQLNKHTQFDMAKEWEEVYGGGEGDEQWTQEEWDEWYRSQEAK